RSAATCGVDRRLVRGAGRHRTLGRGGTGRARRGVRGADRRRRDGRRRRLVRLPVLPGQPRCGGPFPGKPAARLPEAAGGWSDCVLRQDRDGRWWYESLTGTTVPDWVVAALRTPQPSRPHIVRWTPPDRTAHRFGVTACLDAIGAGEIYQACVCTQFVGRIDGAPIDFFADTVARTGPARAAYLAGRWGAVASLSPELFLRRTGEHIASSPIKGTLPR